MGIDSDESTAETLPRVVGGRFELYRLLGEGGFGETFAARDREARCDVAVKILHLDRMDDWKALELFEREARVLKELDHPKIPDYVDFIAPGESPRAYLAQELAPGRSVGDILADGKRFDQESAVHIARQVLDVLSYLETRRPQVIHRDIKPDNLLFDDGSIYVVDFGAVRKIAREIGDGSTVAGTFGYMAPEQLMGRACPASDVFGLGMTLIHMLTGISPDRLEQKRGRPDFRPRAQISSAFADLIDGMTELVVDDRIDSAKTCLELLDGLGDDTASRRDENPVVHNPSNAGRVRSRLEKEEARQARRRKQKHLQRVRRQQEIRRAQQQEDFHLEIVSRGPDSWVMTHSPPRSRLSTAVGPSKFWRNFVLFGVLGPLIIIAMTIGAWFIPSQDHPLFGSLTCFLFTAPVYAVFVYIMVDTNNISLPRENSLELDGDAVLIKATKKYGDVVGRKDKLRAILNRPESDELYGSLHLRIPFKGKAEFNFMTPDELEHVEALLEKSGIPVIR